MTTAPRLAQRLRAETAALHEAVEGGALMRRLIAGTLDPRAYCALLRNLYPIYAALEAAIARHPEDALIAPVWHADLSRSGALAEDLAALQGPDWALSLQPDAEALSYTERLHDIDRLAPGLLLSHIYVRYLGDLSGGQILRRVVGQRLGLADGRGLAFYDFGSADATRALRKGVRSGLEGLEPDANTADALVQEAVGAFARHQRLFDALALQYLDRNA